MGCDLGRLAIAIEAAQKQTEAQWRERYRIAGFEVEEPEPEPLDDGEFNERARSAMAALKGR